MLPQLRTTIRLALDVGVRFATGVDTEYSRRSVAWVGGEIAYLVDAGMSPLAAIQAATIGGAELPGIAARAGSLAPDMEVDLIAVDGNPLERPDASARSWLWLHHSECGERLPQGGLSSAF